LDQLLPVYTELLSDLKSAGAEWVQIDEPVLAVDLSQAQKRALHLAYRQLAPAAPKIMLASYFGEYGHNLVVAADLPISGHHADLVRGRTELDKLLNALPTDRVLSLGLVDGRNIWRANLHDAFDLVEKALAARA
jgi:5-methyltetrahydropteroyltriglutamate--homocysteine methyltransferase